MNSRQRRLDRPPLRTASDELRYPSGFDWTLLSRRRQTELNAVRRRYGNVQVTMYAPVFSLSFMRHITHISHIQALPQQEYVIEFEQWDQLETMLGKVKLLFSQLSFADLDLSTNLGTVEVAAFWAADYGAAWQRGEIHNIHERLEGTTHATDLSWCERIYYPAEDWALLQQFNRVVNAVGHFWGSYRRQFLEEYSDVGADEAQI